MNLNDFIKPPCPKCPYTLGYVKFVVSHCPNCKLNNYQTYRRLSKGEYMQYGNVREE